MKKTLPLFVIALAAAIPALGQELSLFGGVTTAKDFSEPSYAWKIEYRQGLGEHFEFSYSWLNEGHITAHHRDGHSFQLWARENFFGRRLSLALGAGTMRYYDTIDATAEHGYENVHAWAPILSGDVTVYLGKRFTARLSTARVWAGSSKSIDTWDVLLGVGYQLTAPEEPGPRPWPEQQSSPSKRNEVTAYVGQTVVNSFNSQSSVAAALEYRRVISRYFDVTGSFIYEGNAGLVRRAGIAVQGWFGRAFFNERFLVGIGFGAYIAVDEYKNESEGGEGSGTIAGIVTPSIGYRIGDHWLVKFNWNRMATTYDKDTDVFLFGLGVRF
ncbi:MAG: hypothetical protein L6R30_19810 [Thermoanaerobaculia bacterium]|nr:hypothetical protein [Thermoanaerobaculia bacterium]